MNYWNGHRTKSNVAFLLKEEFFCFVSVIDLEAIEQYFSLANDKRLTEKNILTWRK